MQFNSLAHCLVPRRVSANQTHEISIMSEAIGNISIMAYSLTTAVTDDEKPHFLSFLDNAWLFGKASMLVCLYNKRIVRNGFSYKSFT
ncbi:MAG: hypothetical protein CMG93_08720 [Marinomonas sp.]|nr:hypothetical protein [Marinomonas sp.]